MKVLSTLLPTAVFTLLASTLISPSQASAATEVICGVTDRTYIFDTYAPTKPASSRLARQFCVNYGSHP